MSETKPPTPRVPRQGNLIKPPATKSSNAAKQRRRAKTIPPKPAGWLAYLALILLTIASYIPIFNSGLIWSEYDEVERIFVQLDDWKKQFAELEGQATSSTDNMVNFGSAFGCDCFRNPNG